MYESTAKYPEALFGGGNLHAVGLFDECLAVRAPEPYNFAGRYCTVYIEPRIMKEGSEKEARQMRPTLPNENSRASWINVLEFIQLLLSRNETMEPILERARPGILAFPSMGFCIPSSCSPEDLGTAVSELIGSVSLNNTAIVTITDDHLCFSDEDPLPTFDGPEIAMM